VVSHLFLQIPLLILISKRFKVLLNLKMIWIVLKHILLNRNHSSTAKSYPNLPILITKKNKYWIFLQIKFKRHQWSTSNYQMRMKTIVLELYLLNYIEQTWIIWVRRSSNTKINLKIISNTIRKYFKRQWIFRD